MKKTGLILVFVLLALLCACSSSQPESSAAPAPAPQQSAQPANEPDVQEPADSSDAEPSVPPGEEPEESADPKSIAESLIGEEISALYDAIGYPESSDYAPSCLGDGEDGNLYYEGFTVYTYREGDSETVYYVE